MQGRIGFSGLQTSPNHAEGSDEAILRRPFSPKASVHRGKGRRVVLLNLLASLVFAWGYGCSSDPADTVSSADPGPPAPHVYDFPDPQDLPERPEPPDPLILFETGEEVRSVEAWRELRRPEIRALFEHYVYGRAPGSPEELSWEVVEESHRALGGLATRRQVDIRLGPVGAPILHLLIHAPNGTAGSVPAFLGLNFYGNHTVTDDPAVTLSEQWIPARAEGVVDNRATEASRGTAVDRWSIRKTLERGYAVVTAYNGDIDPDFNDFTNGIHPHHYEPGQERPGPAQWGTVAAWAWGLSRAMDYLEQEPLVDAGRVAVMGHSRNGKTALLAGALDERIAVVISNQSGCTGAAISRRARGETVFLINLIYPHWFCTHYKAFSGKENTLPVDQHLLVSLVAPRQVLVLSAAADLWSDPEGEFLGARGAGPVYRLYGMDGLDLETMPGTGTLAGERLAYHIREGDHSIGPGDWAVFTRFCERHLKP